MDDSLEELQAAMAKLLERARGFGNREGYAQALADMNRFVEAGGKRADVEGILGAKEFGAAAKTRSRPNGHAKSVKRHRRGKNKVWVHKTLKAADVPIGATEIQRRIAASDGVNIAYSSVRNALAQLVEAGQAFDDGNGQFTAGKQMALPVETGRVI